MSGAALSARGAAATAACLAALVHLGALGNGFAYDDAVLILGDPGIHSLGGVLGRLVEPSWPGSFGDAVGGWRPLTTLVWALTWAVSPGSEVAFHALGIGLHAATTALLVLVLWKLMTPVAALLGGLIFAVHPVHVEAVANVAGTAEPLAASFALAALLVHLRDREQARVRRALAVSMLYGLAVLAKEGTAVLPLLLVLVDGARTDLDMRGLGPWLRRQWITYAMMGGVLVALLVARSAVLGGVAVVSTPPGGAVLEEIPRIWTIASAWPHYFRLLLFPMELSADYGPDVVPVLFGWSVATGLGVALAVSTLALAGVLWRREAVTPGRDSARLVALGVLWIGAALLPVANVLYLGPVLVAERTLYLPSVGVALAGGWALATLLRRRADLGRAVVVAVVVAGAVRTAARVPVWKSTDTLMTALLETHPESGRAWFALGQRLTYEGRHPEARRAFTYAIGILNSEYKESTEVASHLMGMGRPEAARLLLMRAWRERPEWPTAPGLLASIELNAGRLEPAEEAARAAAAAQPTNGSLHHLLAESLSRLGRHDEAVTARLLAIETGLAGQFRPWFRLAGDHAALGDTLAALAALDSTEARAGSDEERAAVTQLRGELRPLSPPQP